MGWVDDLFFTCNQDTHNLVSHAQAVHCGQLTYGAAAVATCALLAASLAAFATTRRREEVRRVAASRNGAVTFAAVSTLTLVLIALFAAIARRVGAWVYSQRFLGRMRRVELDTERGLSRGEALQKLQSEVNSLRALRRAQLLPAHSFAVVI